MSRERDGLLDAVMEEFCAWCERPILEDDKPLGFCSHRCAEIAWKTWIAAYKQDQTP